MNGEGFMIKCDGKRFAINTKSTTYLFGVTPGGHLKHLYYDELICQQIGDYFNILLKEKLPYCSQYIKFPRHVIYELDVANINIDSEELITEHFKNNYRYIITEDTIQLNFGINMEKRTLQSFSHFSYQISGGQLLITDLEYDNDSRKIIKYNIYRTKNGGYQNIMEFFASHICNNTCKSLELIHPRKKINNPLSKAFFQQKYILSMKLCKCCGVPILLNKDKNDINTKGIIIDDEIFLTLYRKLKEIERYKNEYFEENKLKYEKINTLLAPFIKQIEKISDELKEMFLSYYYVLGKNPGVSERFALISFRTFHC